MTGIARGILSFRFAEVSRLLQVHLYQRCCPSHNYLNQRLRDSTIITMEAQHEGGSVVVKEVPVIKVAARSIASDYVSVLLALEMTALSLPAGGDQGGAR